MLRKNFGGEQSFCLDSDFVSNCRGIHFFLTSFSVLDATSCFVFERLCDFVG